MPTPELLPRFIVLRSAAGETLPATWEDGGPVYRTGLVPVRSLAAARVDAEVLALGEADPDAEFLVVNDAGEVLHRVSPAVAAPF